MFYTGIITSILPYILLIGIFGTVLLNQAFGSPDDFTESSFSHPVEPKYDHAKVNGDAFHINISTKPGTKQESVGSTIAFQQRAWSKPAISQAAYVNSALPLNLHRAVLNTTFSFRGPPFF